MEVQRTVVPSDADVKRSLSEAVDDEPIVMVNLLRFREQADYSASEHSGDRISGRQAYARYQKQVVDPLWSVGGQLLWKGKVRAAPIMPDYEQWDQVLLVYYPNRQAFADMVTSERYLKIVHHRTAALEDSRLIETRAVRLPKPMMAVGRAIVRAKRWLRDTP